jgi:hypothetical protein
MVVQVENRLTGVSAAIGNHTKAVFCDPLFLRQFDGNLKNMTSHLAILGPQIQKGSDMFARNDKNVHARLRLDIFKSHHGVVFIDNVTLDLFLNNTAKETIPHPSLLPIKVQGSILQLQLKVTFVV